MKTFTYEMKDPQRDGELRGRFTVADGDHDLPLPADGFEAHDRALRERLEHAWRENRVLLRFDAGGALTDVAKTATQTAFAMSLEFVLVDEDTV